MRAATLALDQHSRTVKDAESSKNLTFIARRPPLEGITVRDTVTVVFSSEGEKLIARSVKKA